MSDPAMRLVGKGMYPAEVVKIVDRYLPLANEDRREEMAKDIVLVVERAEKQVLAELWSRAVDRIEKRRA